MIMRMRKEKAAQLLQTNTGRMRVPKTGLPCRRGRENILPHAVEENNLNRGVWIVPSVHPNEEISCLLFVRSSF